MNKDYWFPLIDYYIDQYVKEREHKTDGYTLAGLLQGLIHILRFSEIPLNDLGEERLKKLLTGKWES